MVTSSGNATQHVMGTVVSRDPIITWSTYDSKYPLGLVNLFPEQLEKPGSLHFVGFPFSLELEYRVAPNDALDNAAIAYQNLMSRSPATTVIFFVNTQFETLLATRRSFPTVQVHELIFTNEMEFYPRPRLDRRRKVYDAVYNATFVRRKRHELASKINSLMLIYDFHDYAPHYTFAEIKAMLPNARYLNEELGNGEHQLIFSKSVVATYLAEAKVGLSLAIHEAGMRAMMEYLLCGLPVVTVHGVAGRERFLSPDYSVVAEDNPDSVAAGVKDLIQRRIERRRLRSHIMTLLNFERRNFLYLLNRLVQKEFSSSFRMDTIEPFLNGLTHRPIRDVRAEVKAI